MDTFKFITFTLLTSSYFTAQISVNQKINWCAIVIDYKNYIYWKYQ